MGPSKKPKVKRRRGGTSCYMDRLCPRCHGPLPAGYAHHICSTCNREDRRQKALNPNRRCSGCRTRLPVGRLSFRCAACSRADWEGKRTLWQGMRRPCAGCRQLMPKGRIAARCAPCLKEQQQRRGEREDRRCLSCSDLLPWGYRHANCDLCHKDKVAEIGKIYRAKVKAEKVKAGLKARGFKIDV